ncbi:hypothetical protein WDW86_17540 [Bdellovibrionota bacterium FG-2]
MTSLGIGVWAYDVSRFEAFVEWERTHSPPVEAWRNALGKRGFREERDPRKTTAILAALPVSETEMPVQVWRDERWDWMVFVTPEAQAPHFFCAQCEGTAARFHSLDTRQGGWQALSAALAGIDAYRLTQKKSPPQNKRKAFDLRDPREVFY